MEIKGTLMTVVAVAGGFILATIIIRKLNL